VNQTIVKSPKHGEEREIRKCHLEKRKGRKKRGVRGGLAASTGGEVGKGKREGRISLSIFSSQSEQRKGESIK